jgi:glycosyltransferase involved in cell wall biosynthesis
MIINNSLISIITPTYNHEVFIGKCVESVLAQTYPNWEMIIIDDNSQDKTVNIVKSYAEKDKRIKLLSHSHNYGIKRLSDTYNEALETSQGELIAILEGDDVWPKTKLEKQISVFEDLSVVLACGRGKYIDENNQIIGEIRSALDFWPEDVLFNRPLGNAVQGIIMKGTFLLPACSIMLRKESLLKIGGFWQPDGLAWVDRPTALKLSLLGEFKYVDAILGYWRISKTQVTQNSAQAVEKNSGEVFFNSLTDREKIKFGLGKIERRFKGVSLWLKGRKNIIVGNRQRATKFFMKALVKADFNIKIKSIIALVLVLLPRKINTFIFSSVVPSYQRFVYGGFFKEKNVE